MSSELVSRTPVEPPTQLVIIRRRPPSKREEPHSGIWKIAYADFMTAMMAFFLVMWLLNATDKQTIAAVANYFNPVKLSDRVSSPKGLHDMESGAHGMENAPGASRSKDGSSKGDPKAEGSDRRHYSEEALFRDPYGVLEKLAQLAKAESARESALSAAMSSGNSFRDPFDPEFRFLVGRANAGELKAEPRQLASTEIVSMDRNAAASVLRPDAAEKLHNADRDNGEAEVATTPGEKHGPATEQSPAKLAGAEIAEEIRAALREAGPGRIPNVEVTSTADGILISLTDEFDFGMFAIASAEPRPELVVVMEKIAHVVKSYPGALVVRGHTDGRPFRTSTYDNWRLSSARAHMAYFMLMRGGIDERRFERIEGHADRNLRVANEPEAAQNRRIEILLRKAESP